MLNRLLGKNVLITGASAGIGEACAYQFAAAGANVILTARRAERLEAVRAAINAKWPSVQVRVAALDVCDRAAVGRVVGSIAGPIDVLVNNAGVALGMEAVADTGDEAIDGMVDTNIKGLLWVTRAVVNVMKGQAAGHIIMLGSIAGLHGYAGGSVYCATKSAVRAICESLRAETNALPIKVTEILPGKVETEFSLVRFAGDREKADSVYRGIDPLVAEDIAETIVFAASRHPRCVLSEVVMLPKGQTEAGITHLRKPGTA
ncbi:hypothetical protein IWQ56_004447 [Coemansia nantahalensis]|uniref:Uncharacterized protein n=2 Tax=Coemansia TaxID=4863 RepID=A0ACC1L993_9FUNG|nr:hypothetical protein IWQ56_004447 [Coemansia nantahalensis]KAJ2775363.1 hypothetical protein IWQ57_000462 [Coemansia nantahalensis]KAJ2803601.1 hypothetical protein H4R21_001977 [Coemansia helicoidea]